MVVLSGEKPQPEHMGWAVMVVHAMSISIVVHTSVLVGLRMVQRSWNRMSWRDWGWLGVENVVFATTGGGWCVQRSNTVFDAQLSIFYGKNPVHPVHSGDHCCIFRTRWRLQRLVQEISALMADDQENNGTQGGCTGQPHAL